jgi:hypothetical protein
MTHVVAIRLTRGVARSVARHAFNRGCRAAYLLRYVIA